MCQLDDSAWMNSVAVSTNAGTAASDIGALSGSSPEEMNYSVEGVLQGA